MLILYHFLTTLMLIISFPVFFLTRKKSSLKERLGLNLLKMKKTGSRRIWVHSLSVGEIISAIPLLEALKNRYPSREIVLSVKTATGMKVAQERLKGTCDAIVPMPLDFWWSVQRMIDRIQPTIFILVESDIWPGLISLLKSRGIKTILVNGRVSPRTGRAYERWRFLIRRVLNEFELCLMQTELDRFRILKGGVSPDKLAVVGNIKFDREWKPLKSTERKRWLSLMNRKKGEIWVTGSTHYPEERIILSVFAQLLESFPDLSLVMCPRDAHRFDEVYDIARDRGFRVIRKTALPRINGNHNVFILDTLGELGDVYGLADIAFVGGSLSPTGGHNLLEPASHGIPVIFGPHTFNFDAMSQLMIDCEAGIRVNNESQLFKIMEKLLGQQSKRSEIGKRAKQFVERNQGALERVLTILERYIEGSEN